MAFNEIPILDLSLAHDPETKPDFLKSLRQAILEVGFLYIKNTGIDESLIQDVIHNGQSFFNLPPDAKLAVQMKNAKSFLGYNLLGGEITAHKTDWREQIDLSTPHDVPSAEQPDYYNLLAPNQWPDEALLPAFRPSYEKYIAQMSKLSMSFTSLIAEAIGLPSDAFDRFFDEDQQHKLKIVKYPDLDELGIAPVVGEEQEQAQGVGPHKDSMLTSYLLQASHHRGLQAQNVKGEWIDCKPIDGTLVVAIGQGLEAITQGVCQSTTHRVLSPARGQGARYSIPFFQGISYHAEFAAVDIPVEVKEQKDDMMAQWGGRRDDVEFTFKKGGRWTCFGEATFYNRCKSHDDVAQKWYPEMYKLVLVERCQAKAKEQAKSESEQAVPSQSGKAIEAH